MADFMEVNDEITLVEGVLMLNGSELAESSVTEITVSEGNAFLILGDKNILVEDIKVVDKICEIISENKK